MSDDKEVAMSSAINVSTQNERGEWVPGIPEPMYVLCWCRCKCGERRVTKRSYREHYALAHILGLS